MKTSHGWVLQRDGTFRTDESGPTARCGGPGLCPQCSQEAMEAGFHGQQARADGTNTGMVTCPNCRHTFRPVPQPAEGVRTTEA